jgi:nucleoside-diphosphate-sugar epimerase
MTISINRAAVVGATGPAGIRLTSELRQRGVAVRAISRSERHLAAAFPDRSVETAAADALDAEALARAVAGCDLVVDAIGLPVDRMADHARTAGSVASAARTAGARILQISSFWSYLPARALPVDEAHAREGGNAYIQARRAAEDVMIEAGAAVAQLPDFFGPKVHASTLQQALGEAASGKAMTWIGSGNVEREYCFIPDAIRTVADLAIRAEAYGGRWIVPGNAVLTGRTAAELAGRHLRRKVKVRAVGPLMLRLVSLFVPDLRAFLPMVPHYAQPIRYDASKLVRLLGPQARTPIAEAVGITLDWLRRQ